MTTVNNIWCAHIFCCKDAYTPTCSDNHTNIEAHTRDVSYLPDCDNLAKVQFHVVDLCNENGCQCFIECCSIHVDGRTHR